jgi:hypothetical protein
VSLDLLLTLSCCHIHESLVESLENERLNVTCRLCSLTRIILVVGQPVVLASHSK